MPFSAGNRLGPYEILAPIGAGGMGVVYRAHDERLDRDVALKVLPAGALADEASRQRFLKEALALSRLNHPHICTIHEAGEADGQTYIAMEYVQGRPLSTLVRAEGLPVETATRYGAQIADALAHAHERGFAHRDLKSSNVLITPDGRAKLLDFGLAKRLPPGAEEATRSQGPPTEAGTVVGTLHYMAPEVLRGAPADARSDLWALGVVLYEMVTGQLPFQGQTGFEVSSAILRESPAALPPRAPAGLRAIIQRCLAKEPGERYQRASEARAALETAHSDSAGATLAPPRPVRRWWALGLMGAVAAVLLALLAWNAGGMWEALSARVMRNVGPARGARRIASIVVLPLENLSRDPEQDYFADGMTEQMITDLSKIGALRVISRMSAMQYKGARKPLPAIARELSVDAVVVGSVLRSGDRVRITAQLVQAPQEKNLWADSYERDLRDVLALQDEVARTIAGEIKITLTPREQALLGGARQINPEAHQLYLRGEYQANKHTVEGLRKGIEYFEEAITKDPNYALAQVGLASCYALLSSVYLHPREAMPKAKAAALKALELEETLSEAHTWLAFVNLNFDWDWATAEKELRRAIELNPSSADAHLYYSDYFSALGRPEEALAETKRALEVDPFSLRVLNETQLAYLVARRYNQSIELGRKALEREPNFPAAHAYLGLAYAEKREFPQAINELETAVRLDSSPTNKGFLAHVRALAGEKREAEKSIDELRGLYARRYVCPYEVAMTYTSLGDKDKAFEWLEKGVANRADCMIWLKVEPCMDRLRSDPRYAAVMRQVGLAAR